MIRNLKNTDSEFSEYSQKDGRERIIIDTNIFRELFENNIRVLEKLYYIVFNRKHIIYLSPMVYYETMRFLRLKNAEDLIEKFSFYANNMVWIDFEEDDWENAIEFWRKLTIKHIETKGQDADILIAAQAKRMGAKVITNNLSDFKEMDVDCETWK